MHYSYAGDYPKDRSDLTRAMSDLARSMGLAAIGRTGPHTVRRPNGYTYTRAGQWYAELPDGSRRPLTRKERAALNRINMSALSAYASERFEA